MKHGADESSFGICARTILSSDATHRGGNRESNTSGDASALFATLDQTVSALKGDVPGGSLERLGEPSRYLTVVWNASMSEPRHPLCEGYYTRLVGLRRSLASDGVALGGKRRCHGAEHERASRRRADRLTQSRSWLP